MTSGRPPASRGQHPPRPRSEVRELGRPATLDDLPDAGIDRIAGLGFDCVWMLGVWTTGPAGREVSRSQADWREEYRHVLPDVTDEDIVGSPFAIRRYEVHAGIRR